MRVQQAPRNPLWDLLSYSPVRTELEGLERIKVGVELIWHTRGDSTYWTGLEVTDDGYCCGFGVFGVAIGLWQLRVPIIVGTAAYIFCKL